MPVYCPECGNELKADGTGGCIQCSRVGPRSVGTPPAGSTSEGPSDSSGMNVGLGILIMLLCLFLIWPAGLTAGYNAIIGLLPADAQEQARHIPAWRIAITLLGVGILLMVVKMNRKGR